MEGNERITFQSYSDTFKALCPYYMSIGMTYDEFWNGDVDMVKAYREADELRHRRRNQELWLQGMYFYEALCDASPLFRFSTKPVKAEPYIKEPFPITAEEVQEREERKRRVEEERFKVEFAEYVEELRARKMPQEAHPIVGGDS